MTERLYQTDSYRREFEGTVVEIQPQGAQWAVVLDRTAFYPAAGGQPHDTGTLGGVPVLQVLEDEADRIVHLATGRVEGTVTGTIDWPRRFDHMQQHTGQHILSQAFLQARRGQTRAVHLGADLSTLDLDRGDLTADAAGQVEDLANQIVFEDRSVIVREVDDADLADWGLRRPPKKHGRIRVVEVEGFDRSACGGTHVRHTGEVGPIAIRRWEHFKGGLRVEFLCGWRALRDHRWKNALVRDLATRYTVKDIEVADAISRQAAQLRERDRHIAELRDRLIDLEARRRLDEIPGTPKVVAAVVADWPAEMVLALAGRLVAGDTVVAVLGASDGRFVIARSADLDVDAATLLAAIARPRGGRGGGRPAYAQGAVPAAQIGGAVEAARAEVCALLARGPQTSW